MLYSRCRIPSFIIRAVTHCGNDLFQVSDLKEQLNERKSQIEDLQLQLGKREEELAQAMLQIDQEGAGKAQVQKVAIFFVLLFF